MMKLYEVADRNQPLLDALLDIWEQSVRATHLFLSDAEVKSIRAYVPQALKSVEHQQWLEKQNFKNDAASAYTG